MAEPMWLKNLRDALLLSPMVLVHGNVKDRFPVPAGGEQRLPPHLRSLPYVDFATWLGLLLEEMRYPTVVLYDPADYGLALRGRMARTWNDLAGGGAAPPPPPTGPALPRAAAPPPADDAWMVRLNNAEQDPTAFVRTLYDNVLAQPAAAVGVVMRFTDRFLRYDNRSDPADRRLSLLVQKAAMRIAPQTDPAALASRLVLVFNTAGEIPQELHVGAPFAKVVEVPRPTLDEREQFFRDNAGRFDATTPGDRFDPADAAQLRLVANLSDGLNYQDLLGLAALSRSVAMGLGPRQVKPLLDRFRLGTSENLWTKVNAVTLRNAEAELSKRVKGQPEVIRAVVPVLIRAKLGMTDVTGPPQQQSTKPRGVFFFVGPTGVGKTELSKAIAELIFGTDAALIRFDMSEYSEEHQQARLVGSPPGYIGHEGGGQLTNAVAARPFSVVLFDEIEKAHGRILDKFLQVLDDGRLTDGMGRTVYFSETILVFTSNLGTAPQASRTAPLGTTGVTRGGVGDGESLADRYARLLQLDYEDLSDHFRREVREFFVNTLGRPEILNRIGEDNVLVFNFLKDDGARQLIIEQQVDLLNRRLTAEHKVSVECTPAFQRMLMFHPGGFARNGARGVRNLLNKFVVNPLAVALFTDAAKYQGRTFVVDYAVARDKIVEDGFAFDPAVLESSWD